MNYRLKKEYPVVINRKIVVLPKGTILRERKSYSIVSYLIEGVEPETYFNRDVPQNNPEWFEPIYEFKVGGYYRVTNETELEFGNIIKIIKSDGKYSHYKTVQGGTREDSFGCSSAFAKCLVELTPSEIDAVTKKFPFNYSTLSGGVTFNFYVEDGEKDNVIIGAKHRDDIIVTESAWREIGSRKGWSL